MDSLPNSAEMLLNREDISSRASSHVIRFQLDSESWSFAPPGRARAPVPTWPLSGPVGPTLLIGYSTRSGEYTRSKYFATLAHKNPRVTGCAGSPWIFTALPSSTVIRTPQASGQSCGQAAWTTCFMIPDYMVSRRAATNAAWQPRDTYPARFRSK